MPPATVLVVGSLHYDIMVEADHLPRKDETAVGRRWYPKFGGKGGNQAVSAARHGAAARMLGAIGTDDFGRFLRDGLAAGGVDTRFLREIAGVGSGMSVAIQDSEGDYAATIVSGANLALDPAWLDDPALWRDAGLLVLQNEVPEAINLAAATRARTRGLRTLLNAAPFRPLSPMLESVIDVLIVNAVEAEMMGAGHVCCLDSASAAAGKLASRFESVIVTAGSQGLAAWTAEEDRFQLPAQKVDVVSSHGAGDCFIGAFAAATVHGAVFRDACAQAAAAAARHVAGQTPQGKAPD
jgi:ribokinase